MGQGVVAIYARTSKEDRAHAQAGQSLGNQIALAGEWIGRDASLAGMRVEVYQDEGYPGTDMDRPAVKRLLAGIFLGRIQVLVVKDLSRLSRNHLHLSGLLEETFPRYPVRVIAVAECYDSLRQGPAGLAEGIRGIFYEYYCRDISQKTKKSLEAKKESGDHAVGNLPFGYRKGAGGWEICEEEAAVVRKAFSLSLDGWDCVRIAGYLNGTGVLPVSSVRPGQIRWHASVVWRMLNNPVYTGRHVWHKYENHFRDGCCCDCVPREEWKVRAMAHPAIICEEDFKMVQELHPHTAGYGRKKGRRHLFHGITKCGYCGKGLCRHRRRRELIVCRERHGDRDVQVRIDVLWKLCWEIFSRRGRPVRTGCSGEMSEGLSLLEKELFLKCFVRRIWVERGSAWIDAAVTK